MRSASGHLSLHPLVWCRCCCDWKDMAHAHTVPHTPTIRERVLQSWRPCACCAGPQMEPTCSPPHMGRLASACGARATGLRCALTGSPCPCTAWHPTGDGAFVGLPKCPEPHSRHAAGVASACKAWSNTATALDVPLLRQVVTKSLVSTWAKIDGATCSSLHTRKCRCGGRVPHEPAWWMPAGQLPQACCCWRLTTPPVAWPPCT